MYWQITSVERYTLGALHKQGFSQAEIARHLGRHRSSVSRELQRNSARFDGGNHASKHCIVSLVERQSGYLIIGKLRDRTKEVVTARVIQLMVSMRGVTQHRCNEIALTLNIRPRKRHGYKSPAERLCAA